MYIGGNRFMSKDLKETLISKEHVFDGQLLKVRKDTVLLPNGKEAVREWIQHPGAVAVVPILEDGRIVMVKQFRYPVGKVTLEIPAGKLDKGEDPDKCALRELKEETGYTPKTIKKLTTIGTTMAFSNEVIHLYVAEGLIEGEQCLDEDEFLHVEKYEIEEIKKMIREEQIYDAKSLVAILMTLNRKDKMV